MPRALITGAAGFVGRALSARLEQQGWEVVRADAIVPDLSAASRNEVFCSCDVSDAAQVDYLFEMAGPVTHVFHLAAVTFVPDAHRNPTKTFQVNLIGTSNVAHALLRHTPAARLINVASSEVYGPPQTLPITEKHPLAPANPYAISKAAADQYCAYLHRASQLDVVRMRPFNHSGPGQSDSFVLSSFARQIARIEAGQTAPVLRVGNLDARRDFLHVNDVIRAYELAAIHGVSGEAYNVCSGTSVAIRDALDRLLALSPAKITVETDPARFRPVEIPDAQGSHAKLNAATGWQPETPFTRLLGDLIDYWRQKEER